jgi:hypothetical protein
MTAQFHTDIGEMFHKKYKIRYHCSNGAVNVLWHGKVWYRRLFGVFDRREK